MKILLLLFAAGVIAWLAKTLSRSRSSLEMSEEWKQTCFPEHEREQDLRSMAYWK